MTKHQIFIVSNNRKKNLNTLFLLYKQSDVVNKNKHKYLIENNIVNLYTYSFDEFPKDMIIYYNKNNFYTQSSTENIKNKILGSLKSADLKLSYINYLHERVWLINKLTYLSTKFYLTSGNKKLLFTNRLKKDSKNLLKKIYKNVRYRKEKSKLISY